MIMNNKNQIILLIQYMDNFPNEIITHILSFLDIKSLFLFNILTKGCYEDLIKSFNFSKKSLLSFLSKRHITLQQIEFIKLFKLNLGNLRKYNDRSLFLACWN